MNSAFVVQFRFVLQVAAAAAGMTVKTVTSLPSLAVGASTSLVPEIGCA